MTNLTIPSLESLLLLLPDNTSGDIEPVDIRDITTALYNGYLELSIRLEDYLPLAGGTMEGMIVLPIQPENEFDVANKKYVDEVAASTGFVPLTGAVMQGDLQSAFEVPPNPLSFAPKQWVESLIGGGGGSAVLLADGSVNLINGYVPVNDQGVATKRYVDDLRRELTEGTFRTDGYDVVNAAQLATKAYVDNNGGGGAGGGNLKSDGSVPMDFDYVPDDLRDIATIEYVENAKQGGNVVASYAGKVITDPQGDPIPEYLPDGFSATFESGLWTLQHNLNVPIQDYTAVATSFKARDAIQITDYTNNSFKVGLESVSSGDFKRQNFSFVINVTTSQPPPIIYPVITVGSTDPDGQGYSERGYKQNEFGSTENSFFPDFGASLVEMEMKASYGSSNPQTAIIFTPQVTLTPEWTVAGLTYGAKLEAFGVTIRNMVTQGNSGFAPIAWSNNASLSQAKQPENVDAWFSTLKSSVDDTFAIRLTLEPDENIGFFPSMLDVDDVPSTTMQYNYNYNRVGAFTAPAQFQDYFVGSNQGVSNKTKTLQLLSLVGSSTSITRFAIISDGSLFIYLELSDNSVTAVGSTITFGFENVGVTDITMNRVNDYVFVAELTSSDIEYNAINDFVSNAQSSQDFSEQLNVSFVFNLP